MAHILMDADGSDGDWEDTLAEQRELWLRDPRILMAQAVRSDGTYQAVQVQPRRRPLLTAVLAWLYAWLGR